MKDVAATAGVSLGTVSNVLNRPERVRPATRERVERAMAELGFVRNEGARQLRAGRSSALAYVMLDARNPFFTDVAQGIEDAAADEQLSLFICNSAGSAERERVHLEHLQEQRVQGILITPVDPEAEILGDIVRRGTPVVIVDRTRGAGKFCTVAVDDALGGRLAVEHLIDCGHTKVAFIGGPAELGQIQDRWAPGRGRLGHDADLPADQLAPARNGRADRSPRAVRPGSVSSGSPLGAARRRPSAAMTSPPWGSCSSASGPAAGCPRTSPSSGTTTSSSPRQPPSRSTSVRQPRQELGSTAARPGRGRVARGTRPRAGRVRPGARRAGLHAGLTATACRRGVRNPRETVGGRP